MAHDITVRLEQRARQKTRRVEGDADSIFETWRVKCSCGWEDKTTSEVEGDRLGKRHQEQPHRNYRFRASPHNHTRAS